MRQWSYFRNFRPKADFRDGFDRGGAASPKQSFKSAREKVWGYSRFRWLKNREILGSDVPWKKSSTGNSPCFWPSSKNQIELATLRAKPISCVTQTIVIPSDAKFCITSRTSEIISGKNWFGPLCRWESKLKIWFADGFVCWQSKLRLFVRMEV